jgi:hypothetical protein
VLHPPREADALVSLRLQRGNADDVLMAALHPGWRDHPPGFGKRGWHAVTAAAAAFAILATLAGVPLLAAVFTGVWGGRTAALAWRRIAPGPRTAREVTAMIVTSAAIPFAASAWWLVGRARLGRLLVDRSRAPRPENLPETALEAAR